MKSKQLSILVILALMLSLFGVVSVSAAPAAPCVFTSSVTGNWANAAYGAACTPGSNDDVTVSAGTTVTLTAAGAARSVTIASGGTLVLAANNLTLTKTGTGMTVNGTLSATTGVVNDTGTPTTLTINVASGGTLITGNLSGITTSGATGMFQTSTGSTRTYNTGANYIFNGVAAQVTGAGLTGAANLTINNAAGVTLSGSATVTGILALTSGDLTTGANTLNLGAASTSIGTGDVVGNTRRTHTFTPDTSYAYGNPFVVIAFNTGTTTPPTSVNVELVKHTPGSFALATTRAYTITLTGGAGLNATLTLHYAAADLNGNTAANLKLLRWNGSLWQLMGRTGAVDTVNGAVTLAGVTAFSPWAISAQNPTAVTLQDFSAQSNSSPLLPGLLALLVLALGAVAIMTRARRHA